ncbi:DUF3995 domain-containing protein [Bacillus solitudinis]|uniref:DUF3995 domain-containing protein n=1 Tax=Bacillus solitudinis TaxID=2014074 RepID=UPI000C250395|nr:DUF3995 domain-containing protein [Bacillus solitudinis]
MPLFLIFPSVLVMIIISVIHFYWMFGGKWGLSAVVPEKVGGGAVFRPKLVETFIVAIGLLVLSFLLLAQIDLIPFLKPNMITRWFCIIFSFVFFIRAIGDFKYLGFFKKIKHSTFSKYDTLFFSPLCLYLGSSFMVAWIL